MRTNKNSIALTRYCTIRLVASSQMKNQVRRDWEITVDSNLQSGVRKKPIPGSNKGYKNKPGNQYKLKYFYTQTSNDQAVIIIIIII